MAITLNGKPLHKRQTPDHKLVIVKDGILKRDSVKQICLDAGVTANTVLIVRQGMLK